MRPTPHHDKLEAAIENEKCADDVPILEEALDLYDDWIDEMESINLAGKEKVNELVRLLNWYKDEFEVELIMRQGSDFIKRQKGQLKLDNSILEEFFIHLIDPDIITGLENINDLVLGPQKSFMSLSFSPRSVNELSQNPNMVLKTKDQDFSIGTEVHYKLSTSSDFMAETTDEGSFTLSVFGAELKINLDKTMFQEACGTAERLKQGVPVARYYILVEYLDMTPEDVRLTAIDNVFILRRTRRLPYGKRNNPDIVASKHAECPIDKNIVWRFTEEIQSFVNSVLYDPDEAVERGSFIP